jgi:hypothetical protein
LKARGGFQSSALDRAEDNKIVQSVSQEKPNLVFLRLPQNGENFVAGSSRANVFVEVG